MGKRTIFLGMVISDLPWTPSRVRLPVEPTLFTFTKTVHRNFGIGGVIIEILVSVPHINADCKSLKVSSLLLTMRFSPPTLQNSHK